MKMDPTTRPRVQGLWLSRGDGKTQIVGDDIFTHHTHQAHKHRSVGAKQGAEVRWMKLHEGWKSKNYTHSCQKVPGGHKSSCDLPTRGLTFYGLAQP